MAQMTIEQQQALALARARLRLQQTTAQATPSTASAPAEAAQALPSVFRRGVNPRTGLPDTRDTGKMEKAFVMARGAALEGGGAAAGQTAGAFTGVAAPVAIPVLGAIGGGLGDYAEQRLEMAKNPAQGYSLGRTLGAMASGAIPGASLAGASAKTVGKEMVKQGAANVAAGALETAVDEKRLPTAGEALMAAGGGVAAPALGRALDRGLFNAALAAEMADRAVLDQTIKMGKTAGYVFPPSKINENIPNSIMQSLGGDSIGARASRENQKITNQLAKRYAGLPENVPLSVQSIELAIQKASKPYEQVANLSAQAKLSLEEMKQFRAEAKKAWRNYDNSPNPTPEMRDKAQYLTALADTAEQDIANEATRLGRPELARQLDQARVKLAKIHMLDESINEGTGFVNAQSFSRAMDYGRLLTDEAVTIARVAKAFPESTREWSKIAAVPSGRVPGAQQLQLSSPYQVLGARSSYSARRPDIAASISQYASRAAGRDQARLPRNLSMQEYMQLSSAVGGSR